MNTTRIPHRSIYIPDHTNFALGIIGKYHATTDHYLGLLGLTFRENQLTEGSDTAPLYEFMVHLHLQLQQLKHDSNMFIGSRMNTIQLLQKNWQTHIAFIQTKNKVIYNTASPSIKNRSENFLQTNITQLKDAFTFSTQQNKLAWRLVDRHIASNAAHMNVFSLFKTNIQTRLSDVNRQVKQTNITETISQEELQILHTINQISLPVYASILHASLAERTLHLHINQLKAFTNWNSSRSNNSELSVNKSFNLGNFMDSENTGQVNQTWNLGTKTIQNNSFNSHLADHANFINYLINKRSNQEVAQQNLTSPRLLLIDRKQQDRQFITIFSETKPQPISLIKQYNSVLKSSLTTLGISSSYASQLLSSNQKTYSNLALIDLKWAERAVKTDHSKVLINNTLQAQRGDSEASFSLRNGVLASSYWNQHVFQKDELLLRLKNAQQHFIQSDFSLVKSLANYESNYSTNLNQTYLADLTLVERSQMINGTYTIISSIRQQGTLLPMTQNNENNASAFVNLPAASLIDRKQIERGLITIIAEESVLDRTASVLKQITTQINETNTSYVNKPAVLLIDRKLIERGLITSLAEQRTLAQKQSTLNQLSLTNQFVNTSDRFLNYVMFKQTTIQSYKNSISFAEIPTVLLVDRKQQGLIATLVEERAMILAANTAFSHETRRLSDIAAKEFIKPGSMVQIESKQQHVEQTNRHFTNRLVNERIGELGSAAQMMFLHSHNNKLLHTSYLTDVTRSKLAISLKLIDRSVVKEAFSDTQHIIIKNQALQLQMNILEKIISSSLSPVIMQRFSLINKLNIKQTNILSGALKKAIKTNQNEYNHDLIIAKVLPKENFTEHIVRERIDQWSSIMQLLPNLVDNQLLENVSHELNLQLNLNQITSSINDQQSLVLVDRRMVSALQRSESAAQPSPIAKLVHSKLNLSMIQPVGSTLYDPNNLTEKIVRERIGESAAVMRYMPIHATNKLVIDQRFLANFSVIKEQQLQQLQIVQRLIENQENEKQNTLHVTPQLQEIVLKRNFDSINMHQNQHNMGPSISFQTSLTPIIFQKYGERRIEDDLISNEQYWTSNAYLNILGRQEQDDQHIITLTLIDRRLSDRGHAENRRIIPLLRQFKFQLKEIQSNQVIQFSNNRNFTEQKKSQHRVHNLIRSYNQFTKSIIAEKNMPSTHVLLNAIETPDSNSSVHYQTDLSNHIVRERLGEMTNVLRLNPIHTNNNLLQTSLEHTIIEIEKQQERANKQFSSLKLIDRNLIDRGILSAVTVYMQKPEFKQLRNRSEASSRSVELQEEASLIVKPKLLQTVIQLNERRSKLDAKGPVISYQTSLSPLIYQKFANNQTRDTPSGQIKRALTQTASKVPQIPLQDNPYLTNKIVQVRMNDLTTVVKFPTQMSAVLQQAFDKQLQGQNDSTQEIRTSLVLVDRNRIEHNLLDTVTVILEKQMNPNVTRPDIIADRAQRNLASNETMTTINEDMLLLNRRIQREAAAATEKLIVQASIADTTTALDYRKTKPAPGAELNQSSTITASSAANNLAELKIDKAELNAAQFPKHEFDKIVDKVFKEIQKRFTFERQRRGM